jgi:23S rRNA (cytosine1962-C5)-methyltransferase
MTADSIVPLLSSALAARADLFDARHETAFRLFNGFYESYPELVIDLYARTVVIHNYADEPAEAQAALEQAQAFLRVELPWVTAIVVKTRHASRTDQPARCGVIVYGEEADRRVRDPGSEV